MARGADDRVDLERLATVFSALSDPTRLQMFETIVQRGQVWCTEFDEMLPLAKSTISYHSKLLAAAGLIETHRDGRWFYYTPTPDGIEDEVPGLLARLKGGDLGAATSRRRGSASRRQKASAAAAR